MTETEDLELVTQCQGGDRKAFAVLVERYQKPMFNVALRMTRSFTDAEDITQCAFLKAYEGIGSFDRGHRFFSWLYRITVNETLNFLKRRKQVEQLDEDIVADEGDPEQSFDDDASCNTVQNALMELKEDYRAVIVLKHLQGLSYCEISRILDIPEKKVKSRLFSARLQLKDVLVAKGIERR